MGARAGLSVVNLAHRLVGTQLFQYSANLVRKLSGISLWSLIDCKGNRIPQWNPYIPTAAPSIRQVLEVDSKKTKVVYFPTCVNRIMGPASSDKDKESLHEVIGIQIQFISSESEFPAR